jgi:hypothetical protein
VLPECARGKRKDEGYWPFVLAQRARMVKLIVTLWAVLRGKSARLGAPGVVRVRKGWAQ